MKDWEVQKVNELYKQIDVLVKQNQELKEYASLSALEQRLDSIESKIDEICKCCECGPPVKSKKTAVKKTK